MSLTPKKGHILVSDPSILNDTTFKRSIILLTEHDEKSSLGFIINRPTEFKLHDLLPNIDCNYDIYTGGPVERNNLYFIHRIPDLLKGSIALKDGLFWGGDFKELQSLLNKQKISTNDIRFFLGYSGWDRNQLEEEINSNTWYVTKNCYSNILKENHKQLWKKEILKKGDEMKLWANAPENILLN